MHGHREGLLDSNQLSSIDILVLRQERARQRVKQPANHNCVMICSVLESLATSHQATSLVPLTHKSSQRLTSNRKLTTSNHSRHTCSSGYFAILANESLSFDGIQHHSFYNTYATDTCCFGRATKRLKLLTNFT